MMKFIECDGHYHTLFINVEKIDYLEMVCKDDKAYIAAYIGKKEFIVDIFYHEGIPVEQSIKCHERLEEIIHEINSLYT